MELRPSDYPGFVAAEFRSHGSDVQRDATTLLVQAVGQDLRSLAAAADQLAHDFPGEKITVARVKQYFGGRAEAKSFAVADAAFAGNDRAALEELRWAMDAGTARGARHLGLRRQRPGPGPAQGRPRARGRPTWPARWACRRGSSSR